MIAGGNEKQLIESEFFGRILCFDKMPDMDRIEGAAEYAKFIKSH